MSSSYNQSTQSGAAENPNPLLRTTNILSNPDDAGTILDKTWSHQAFMLAPTSVNGGEASIPMADIDIRNRTFSTAELKFTDTTLGGNYAVNALPQFTQYSDIRSTGRLVDRQETGLGAINGRLGMGRYYSEAIDDHSQLIHMRFGVPNYNSLTQFFTGFYNVSAGRLAKTGRTNTFFGTLGSTAGFVFGLVAQITFWPLLAVHALGYVGSFFFGKKTSKFYYLKPTMIPYWSSVNSMVNKIAVGRGLYPVILKPKKNQTIGQSYEIAADVLKNLHDMMPEVFSPDGGYDIYVAASKAERYRIASDRKLYEKYNGAESESDFYGIVQAEGQTKLNKVENGNTSFSNGLGSGLSGIRNAIQQFITSPSTYVAPGDGEEKESGGPEKDIRTNTGDANFIEKFFGYLTTEFNDGTAFATMRVDYTGPVQESFSNSVRESDISSKANSVASQARSAKFTFAGGNIIGGAAGAVIGAATSAVGGFIEGTLDSMQFSGLLGLAGGSFVDIPKHWDSSSANLPKSSYSIQLRSPYGNVISQMQNIYIPLCMLLAGALPLSTGKQSYTSPFILEFYDRGRNQTRLGMIDSLSITRGTSNLGFNRNGQAMGIDVSFSIVDMSSIMHMQMSKGFLSNDDNGIFDEETVFTDYMNTLSSLGLKEQIHSVALGTLRAARSVRNLQSLTSAAAWAGIVKENTPVGLLEVFYRGTQRL